MSPPAPGDCICGGGPELVRQLALPITLPDAADFDSYRAVTAAGGEALSLLPRLPPASLAYLWGGAGTGKTHLVMACCRRTDAGLYLPLAALRERSPTEVLGDLDRLEVLALDEFDAVAGDPQWELALFHLHNRLLGGGGRMVIAARASPRALAFGLPDLRSRLLAGYGFGLSPYTDDQLLDILRFRAGRLGLNLGIDAARYLLHRMPRELGPLIGLLHKLDRAALADQRQLTIPFIKRTMAEVHGPQATQAHPLGPAEPGAAPASCSAGTASHAWSAQLSTKPS